MTKAHFAPRREPAVIHVAQARTAVVRATDMSWGEMRGFYDRAFAAIARILDAEGLSPVGPAFALHHRLPDDTADLEVGFAVDHRLSGDHPAGDGLVVVPSVLPEGPVAMVSHLGPYEGLPGAWQELVDWAARSGHEAGLPLWEVYVTEPAPDADPESLRTDLFLRVKD